MEQRTMLGSAGATDRWAGLHQLLHWAVAALILFQLVVGNFFLEFKDNKQPPLLPLHVSVGVLIALLMLGQLVSRLARPRPALSAEETARLAWLARATHAALYVLVLTQFTIGYLLEDTFGARVHLFGLNLPVLVGETKGLPKLFGVIHRWIGYALLATVALHVAGALVHEFRFRDNVLRRMTPLALRRPGR